MGGIVGNPRIKGVVVLARRQFVLDRWGEEGWRQVLARLAPADQEALGQILLHAGWYPFELGQRLDDAIASVHSPHDRRQIFLDMGRASADVNLSQAHRAYVRPGEPQFLLRCMPDIYKAYYDTGHRTYEKAGPTAAVLRTYDAENVTADDCLTVVGWLERATALCGGREVQVRETCCRVAGAPFCEYVIEWR
jgi:uncharacterized protein (TIGR02265 family)